MRFQSIGVIAADWRADAVAARPFHAPGPESEKRNDPERRRYRYWGWRESAGESRRALEQGLAEAVRFELTDGSPHRQFSRLLP